MTDRNFRLLDRLLSRRSRGLATGVGLVAVISLDGRSNWLEGLQLISVFTIIALAAFFL